MNFDNRKSFLSEQNFPSRETMTDEKEEEVIEALLDKFRDKLDEKDSLEKKIKDFNRDVKIVLDSGEEYMVKMNGGDIGDPYIPEDKEASNDADIVISSDIETLEGLLNDEIGVMQAYAKNRISIDAPLTDMLKFRKLL